MQVRLEPEYRIICLKKITIHTNDSFGETHEFTNWSAANRYLSSYHIRYWEHVDERIHYHIEWEQDYQVSDFFYLPEEENLPLNYLQTVVQDFLSESSLLPDHSISPQQVKKVVSSVSFLSEYIKFQTMSDFPYTTILAHAEGMNHKRYKEDSQRLENMIQGVLMSHPYTYEIVEMAKTFYQTGSSFKNRTNFFKDSVLLDGKRFITKGLMAGMNSQINIVLNSLEVLEKLTRLICRELNVADERFTTPGQRFYHLFPQDIKDFPESDHILTDKESQIIRDRMMNIRLAPPPDTSLPDSTLFYACYSACLEEVLLQPKEKRSHRNVSRMVFDKLQAYRISKERRITLIDWYDPFSVGNTSYGDKIAKECKKEETVT